MGTNHLTEHSHDKYLTDTGSDDLYIATTGNDTTGNGSSGTPYATLAKALSVLPKLINKDHTIHVADGTYAEAIVIEDYMSSGGRIIVSGNTTTPANVNFTGTTSRTRRGQTLDTVAVISGRVGVELEGIRLNATADHGLWVYENAAIVFDRSSVTGTLSKAIVVWDHSSIEFQGDVSLTGFSDRGIQIGFHSSATYTSAGTITVTAANSAAWGVHIVDHSSFGVFAQQPTGLNITVEDCTYGFQIGLNAIFTHQAATGTITIDNDSTPSNSAAVQTTDCSSWSTTQEVIADNFTYAFEANSISYIEAVGSRTLTNMASGNSNATQNSVIFLP